MRWWCATISFAYDSDSDGVNHGSACDGDQIEHGWYVQWPVLDHFLIEGKMGFTDFLGGKIGTPRNPHSPYPNWGGPYDSIFDSYSYFLK